MTDKLLECPIRVAMAGWQYLNGEPSSRCMPATWTGTWTLQPRHPAGAPMDAWGRRAPVVRSDTCRLSR